MRRVRFAQEGQGAPPRLARKRRPAPGAAQVFGVPVSLPGLSSMLAHKTVPTAAVACARCEHNCQASCRRPAMRDGTEPSDCTWSCRVATACANPFQQIPRTSSVEPAARYLCCRRHQPRHLNACRLGRCMYGNTDAVVGATGSPGGVLMSHGNRSMGRLVLHAVPAQDLLSDVQCGLQQHPQVDPLRLDCARLGAVAVECRYALIFCTRSCPITAVTKGLDP